MKKSSFLMSLEREKVVALVQDGFRFTKNSLLHYDVCQALKEGKTAEKIAELFQIAEIRHVWWIRDHKCPDCRK